MPPENSSNSPRDFRLITSMETKYSTTVYPGHVIEGNITNFKEMTEEISVE